MASEREPARPGDGIRRIVVATDFSEPASAALEEALALAERSGAEVAVVHAVPAEDSGERAGAAASAATELDSLVDRIAARHARVKADLLTGRPAIAICEAADRLDADLVVVGSHGRTGYRRLLQGSVAERVLRHCERTVLVARGAAGELGYRSILAATDFSAAAERALRLAAQLAASVAAIRILHFYLIPSVTAGPDVMDTVRQIEQSFAERLASYRRELGRGGLAIELTSEVGHATRGLLEAIDTGRYDLVSMGRSRHVGLRGHTIGTVAESVARHARCSTLVAAPPR